jgi:aspartate 1-decarboxylase
MNERIRELAEQAGIAVWGDAVYMYHPSETLDSTVMTKFAELIVRECVDIVDNAVTHREPASTYVNKIKEHFGVEE